MDQYYVRQLPSDVQALVEDTERKACIDIQVKIDPTRAGQGPSGQGILACDMDETCAVIFLPDRDYFPPGGVIHELLHIRRMLVEGTPRLVENLAYAGWTPGIPALLRDLDNLLEHLAIVPEEIRRAGDRRDYWETVTIRTFQKDIPKLPPGLPVRRTAILQSAFLEIVLPGSPVREIAKPLLEANGLTDEAAAFAAEMAPFVSDKVKLVQYVFKALDFPVEMAKFECYNSCAGTATTFDITG